MACSNKDKASIHYNGSEIKNDTGCSGDVHQYVASTTLSDPTYKWTIDGVYPNKPVLSSSSIFNYTFDNKTHRVFLVVSNNKCGIQVDVEAEGRTCVAPCPSECDIETVDFPAGAIKSLIDNRGNTWNLQNQAFICEDKPSNTNNRAVKYIQSMLKAITNCSQAPITVEWKHNKGRRNCITLTITNSPVKFKYVWIDNTRYEFNTKNC